MNPLVSDGFVLSFIFSRLPSKEVEIVRKTLRANVQEVEKNISTAEVDTSKTWQPGKCALACVQQEKSSPS